MKRRKGSIKTNSKGREMEGEDDIVKEGRVKEWRETWKEMEREGGEV